MKQLISMIVNNNNMFRGFSLLAFLDALAFQILYPSGPGLKLRETFSVVQLLLGLSAEIDYIVRLIPDSPHWFWRRVMPAQGLGTSLPPPQTDSPGP